MFFYRHYTPGLAIYSYLIGDEKTRQCAVIDPVRDVAPYIDIAEREGYKIAFILETHVHADFVSGARELKQRLDGMPLIYCSGLGGKEWIPSYADKVVEDKMSIAWGDLRLEAVHTPGHTPEHIIWALYDNKRSADTPLAVFSGDLLFAGSVGRPDLLGQKAQQELGHQLYESLFQKLNAFPDFVEIFPAHGAGSFCGKGISARESTTLGYEQRFNPAMQKKDEPAWTAALLKDMPEAPPYFARLKKINVTGAPILGDTFPGTKALSPEEVQSLLNKTQVFDVRGLEAFSAAHIPGAVNVPLSPNFPVWAGWVLKENRPIVLVLNDKAQLKETVIQLVRIGFDQCLGHLDGGMAAWEGKGLPVDSIPLLAPSQLHKDLNTYQIIDVRTPAEWAAGHIEGALHLPVTQLENKLASIPKEKPLAIICGTGYRASIAASLLKLHGFHNISNVLGGMTAWTR